jgi:hypothetical protein
MGYLYTDAVGWMDARIARGLDELRKEGRWKRRA